MNPFHQPTSEENMSAAKKKLVIRGLLCSCYGILSGYHGVVMLYVLSSFIIVTKQLLGHSVWLPGSCYAVYSE